MQLDRDLMQREPLIAKYFEPAPPGPLQLDFPPLEDPESIQLALSMLLSALGQGRIEPKRAGTMLYGLQVASANARTLQIPHHTDAAQLVRDTTLDESGHNIAPDEDPLEIVKHNQWMDELEADGFFDDGEEDDAAKEEDEAADAPSEQV